MRAVAIVKYVFLAIGIGMLGGALYWYQHTKSFIATASVAQGEVVDLLASRSSDSVTYKPVVRFRTGDGRSIEFASSTSSNPPSYSKGEKVEVLYAPGRPENAMINGFFSLWFGPLLVGGLGAVFGLIGGGIMLYGWQQGQREAWLRTHGTPVQARLQGVELNTSLTVNGANPYRIVAQWQNPATAEIHVFRSANLWFDPTEHVTGGSLTVYVDPANPKKHWVDVSFLPKLAE